MPSVRSVLSAVPALTFLLVPAASGGAQPAGAELVDAGGLAAHVRFLASDLLEGRAPGSRGDELARAYLASQLEAAGFAPGAADGTWQQRFEMVGLTSQLPASWRFRAGDAELDLAARSEWIAGTGVQAPVAEIAEAEIVFAGYGIQAPEHDWDDFKGADLRGKVLLLLNDDPDWDPDLFAGKTWLYYGRWTYKYESAARQGAAAAIVIHTTPSAGYPWQVVRTSWGGEQFELPARDEPRIQIAAWTTEEASRRLAALGGHDLDQLIASARSRDFRPVPLGVTTSLRLEVLSRRVETANVLGLLRGSDPRLAEEVVVLTAHHDHLGVGDADARGDGIYNGALDNATGCAQLLEIAQALGAIAPIASKPRRSVLIAFVAAEEQGLLGSAHYAAHPTFAAGRIAANLNVDSANIYGRTRDVTYIGYGRSSLDLVVERAAAAQGRIVQGDQAPEKGSFYRSDQFNFARIGVPAVYLDPGTDFIGPNAAGARRRQQAYESTCYHQPCDELGDDWVWDGMVEDTQLALAVTLAIADADELPAWHPGDEFLAARTAALREVAAEPAAGSPAAK